MNASDARQSRSQAATREALGDLVGMIFEPLALATTASADHVSATFTVTAKVGERVGNSWRVEVDWAIACQGRSDALYFETRRRNDCARPPAAHPLTQLPGQSLTRAPDQCRTGL